MPEIHSALNLGLDYAHPAPTTSPTKTSACGRTGRSPTPPTPATANGCEKELEDRYGPVPEAVRNLLEYSAFKTLAEKIGHRSHRPAPCLLNVKFHQETHIDPARLMQMVSQTQGGAIHSGRCACSCRWTVATARGEVLEFLSGG